MGNASVVTIDVREMAPRDRHPKIFQAFHDLPVNGTMRLINDHDPKPLYYHFQAEHPGEVVWEPQQEGPEAWIINITKVEHSCC